MPADEGDDVATEDARADGVEEEEHLVLEFPHLDEAAAAQAHHVHEDRAMLIDAVPRDPVAVLRLRVLPEVISRSIGSHVFFFDVAAQQIVNIDIFLFTFNFSSIVNITLLKHGFFIFLDCLSKIRI